MSMQRYYKTTELAVVKSTHRDSGSWSNLVEILHPEWSHAIVPDGFCEYPEISIVARIYPHLYNTESTINFN
uniref:Uncharacterized protein n=1 Tax=Onchocerca volvulus TaxID=6282 RepID=A0A8R1Y5Q9_ONCVO